MGQLSNFFSPHTHTTFSYGDGYGLPKEHAQRLAELGAPGAFVTEHGNTSSHVQWEKACKEAGIKPGFGCELYTAPDREKRKWHLTALAENQEGYRNLNRLVTRSWDENFYQWPTVDGQMLFDHSEGLIVTSGCADSLLSCTLLGGKSNGPKRDSASSEDVDNAIRVVERFKHVFGDRYFLEVQQFPGLDRTCTLNPIMEEISARTGVPLLATADVHYPLPDDNEMQKILHSAMRGGTVESAEASWEYDIRLTYPLSDRALWKNLVNTGLSRTAAEAAIRNTYDLGQRCTVELPKTERIRFPTEPGQTAQELIWQRLREGWAFRARTDKYLQDPKNRKKCVERLNYEMELIHGKDFDDYFLVVSELVSWAKDAKIAVGPARGSAAASLAGYLLRITEVNPMLYPTMVFERFIDPGRMDEPDIDLDFQDDRRDEVRRHAAEVYGEDHVGNIANFTKYKGKNSIDDIARVYRVPKWQAEKVKSMIVERSGGDSRQDASLIDTVEMFPQVKEVFEDRPELYYAPRLEGNYRSMSVHAAGIVISNDPINDTCAMYTREVGKDKHKVSVLAYDKKDSAYLNMLKLDALGLSTMGMISIALEMIGMDLEELYAITMDEPETLRGFAENDVVGIFQFEGRATRLVNKDVQPEHFMHLADINALSRPGPLFSGMTAQYVDIRHGREEPEKLHPMVDAVTSFTYGQIVYQEQVLQIIKELGGFPVAKIGDIRKIISQKLGEMSFQAMYEEFQAGCATVHERFPGQPPVTPELAARIWKFMVTSATYSFNIAHCVSYSMLAFWCMWLKRHHPVAFYTAQLRKMDPNKWEKISKLLKDAMKHGITVDPPDLKKSGIQWTGIAEENRITAGFIQIPGVGDATAGAIIRYRDEYGFDDWPDLQNVKGIGPKSMEKIRDFCYSDDPFGLHRAKVVLDAIRDGRNDPESDYYGVPRLTHTSDTIPSGGDYEVTWAGLVRSINYQNYIENQRTRTGDSEDEIIARMKDPHLVDSCVLRCYDDGDEDVYVRFNRWAYPAVKAAIADIAINHDVIVVKGLKRDDFGVSLHCKNMMVIDPEAEED